MFEHSIKVPRLYKTAANIAKNVKENKESIKELLYKKKHPNISALYALVLETLQKHSLLDSLIVHSQILLKESRLDPWLARVLITELLWGKKRILGESKPVKTVLSYAQSFYGYLSSVVNDVEQNPDAKVQRPRYVRVNTLYLSMLDAVNGFQDEGWMFVRSKRKSYKKFLKQVANLKPDHFMVDFHIKELLIFPPGTKFHDHVTYKNGSIILQDKASCLPIKLLNPVPGSVIIDMCAAPGMKTSQMAALLNNNCTIFSVEWNDKRFDVLKKLLVDVGVNCVTLMNKDVLTLTDKDCPNAEYILVDPSCSGSGMLDRLEIDLYEKPITERLDKLSGFQIKTLRHALTRFPQAKRVVYSTCSIHQKENEFVVKEVLATCTRFKLVPVEDVLGASWLHFGSSEFGDIGRRCLYAKPEVDLTNGFFVAVFDRLEDGEVNEFQTKVYYNKANGNNTEVNKKFKQKSKRKYGTSSELSKPTQKSMKIFKKKRKHGENKAETLDTAKSEHKEKRKKRKAKEMENGKNNVLDTATEIETIIIEDEPVIQKKIKRKKNESSDPVFVNIQVKRKKHKKNSAETQN